MDEYSTKGPEFEQEVEIQPTKRKGFQPGNKEHLKRFKKEIDVSNPECKWLKRKSIEEFQAITKVDPAGNITVPDVENTPGHSKLLRPIRKAMDVTELDLFSETDTELRFVNRDKTPEMMDKVTIAHLNLNPGCHIPKFQLEREEKWGFGWAWKLKCRNCTFISKKYKLYDEVESDIPSKHGRKAAASTVRFQCGLQETPLGITGARKLLATTGTVPPSKSTMQRTANKVSEITVELTKEDLKEQIERIKDINEHRGLDRDAPIAIEMDAMYGSDSISSRHKFGQKSNRAVATAIENVTGQKKVIGLVYKNKLCMSGAWLRNNGYNVSCPGHVGCTATTDECEPLSEYAMGYDIGKHLAESEILVKYATTDGDGKSAAGLEQALRDCLSPMWSVSRLADTVHRNQYQFRSAMRAEFSEHMFPGPTKKEKQEQQLVFSQDLKSRSSAIFQELFKIHNGNTCSISKVLPKVLETVLLCYSGNCSKCRYYTTCCKGGKNPTGGINLLPCQAMV